MSFFKTVYSVILALSLSACGDGGSDKRGEAVMDKSRVEVATKQGRVRGAWLDAEKRLVIFKAIPFAEPPVGDLRWVPPKPPQSWEGVRDATQYSKQCMQVVPKPGEPSFAIEVVKGLGLDEATEAFVIDRLNNAPRPEISEDCLYLNVTTPALDEAASLPVMVWIHGGSHRGGSADNPMYRSRAIPEKGIVLVTINYRLGIFGYMAHPAITSDDPRGVSGNYGILDQIAALEWVKANISEFGGDPDNVTIFGESAGGQAVSELMASPLADGLYHKAIMQSGVYSWNPVHMDKGAEGLPSSYELAEQFFEASGLAGKDATAEDLRALDATDIIEALRALPAMNVFLPSADGLVQPSTVGEAILRAKTRGVPILLGYNADEGTLFYPWFKRPTRLDYDYPKDHAERMARFKEVFQDDAAALIAAYGLDDEAIARQGEIDMLGDDSYGLPTRMMADGHAQRGLPVYLYHFRRTPPGEGQTAGAHHASEISFVFDTHSLPITDGDKQLTEAMTAYWANFAKTGNPNNEEGLTNWPLYTPETREWLVLDHDVHVEHDVRKEKLDALESTFIRLLND